MHLNTYAPFFRQGRLFLPQNTTSLLIEHGLDEAIAQSATNGLRLDDHREKIGIISNTLELVLEKLVETDIYDQLNSVETRFMLSVMEDEILIPD